MGKIKWCEKANFEKFKYEITTDLPLARAHCFEFDEQDSSPVCLAFGVPSWRSR
jgi:hypothetical protein